jgi:hypothetical protein
MGKFSTMRYVPRPEFEALQRFPDYELLTDGTLSRVETDGHEFRVIDETADRHFPFGAMTPALQSELQDHYRRSWQDPIAAQENARVAHEYLATLDNARKLTPLAQEPLQEELFPPPSAELPTP